MTGLPDSGCEHNISVQKQTQDHVYNIKYYYILIFIFRQYQ